MKLSSLSFTALAFGLAGASLTAQTADTLICDATNDRVYRSQDLDGDGQISDASEYVLFFKTSDLVDPGLSGTVGITSVQGRVESGVPTVYWTSGFGSEADCVGRAVDLNGDGRMSGDEMTVFFNGDAMGLDFDADGLALTDDGAVWISSDFDGDEGVWRLEDTTGDGVADSVDYLIDGGSGFTLGYGGEAGVAEGTQTGASGDDFQWLTPIGATAVIGYEGFSSNAVSSEDCIFRLEDMNGDGDLLDGYGDGDPLTDEARLFLNYTGKNPLYPANDDFLNGTLRSPMVDPVMSGSTGSFVRLMHTGYVNKNGVANYFFASETSSASTFNLNTDNPPLALNGLIYRGVDNNGDNDVNDAGEVTLFYDGSTTGPQQGMDKILGVKGIGDWLYVLDLANGSKAFHRFQDFNDDGDAMDVGEAEFFVLDLGGYDPLFQGMPRIPFTDPAPPVFSQDPNLMALEIGFVTTGSAIPAGEFAPVNDWFIGSGTACSTFGGPSPKQSCLGLPRIDSLPGGSAPPLVFSVSDTGSLQNDPLIMYGSTSSFQWFGTPLPLDLGLFNANWNGCSLYVNPQFPNVTVADANGEGSVTVGVPLIPSLAGAQLFTQWICLSSAGVPGQIFSATGLGTFTVEQ